MPLVWNGHGIKKQKKLETSFGQFGASYMVPLRVPRTLNLIKIRSMEELKGITCILRHMGQKRPRFSVSGV